MSELATHSEFAVIRPGDTATLKIDPPRPLLGVRSFGMTDPGKVRKNNEDQFLIAVLVKALQVDSTSLPKPNVQYSTDRSHLFIVADGMGGHRAGEKASALAIDSVETFVLESFKWFAQLKGRDQDEVLADFQSALAQANGRVLSEAAEHPEFHGMGTTLTLAYSLNDELFVAHVGDSRCYLFRKNVLYRLTRDHTLVEEMVRQGAITPEQAETHRWRHVITNAVGGDSETVRVEVHKLHQEADDLILLCSDGLTEMVAEQEIAAILQREPNPEPAGRQLVALANEAGGRDNITVVLARYETAR